MTLSPKGREIIQKIPRERLLTETDGPHVTIGRAPAMPWDVAVVERAMASWSEGPDTAVREQVWRNFHDLLKHFT
jgi:TatD DNase family protein